MKHFVGIDIQARRDCCYAVINETGKLVKSGCFSNPLIEAADLIKKLQSSSHVAVGIDASRMSLISKRQWYWSGAKRKWNGNTKRPARNLP